MIKKLKISFKDNFLVLSITVKKLMTILKVNLISEGIREANITQTNIYTLKILKNLKFKRISKSMKVSQIPKYVPKIEISKSSKSALIRFQENYIHLDFSEILFDKQLCWIKYILTLKMPVSQQIWIPLNSMPLNANSNVVEHVICWHMISIAL